MLGREQLDWLIREVGRSRANWKVIAADRPLGLVVPDGPVNQESLTNRDRGGPLGKELELAAVLSAFKSHQVKNVVWLTADVHYCAAHHYTRPAPRSPTSTRSWSSKGSPSTPTRSSGRKPVLQARWHQGRRPAHCLAAQPGATLFSKALEPA